MQAQAVEQTRTMMKKDRELNIFRDEHFLLDDCARSMMSMCTKTIVA